MGNGVLSNSHIPPLSTIQISRELNRLSGETLFNLMRLWFSMRQTCPSSGTMESNLIKLVQLRDQCSKANLKRKLIDFIMVEFYPKGLNALQLAQIDVQSLIDKPNIYSWITASTKVKGKEEVIHFDPQSFLNKLISNLNNLYLCHIYISRHPKYPMYLIRIQIFDHAIANSKYKSKTKAQFESHYQRYRSGKESNSKSRKFVQSLKPQYILLPLSTPNVIYTSSIPPPSSGKTNDIEDLSLRLLLQTLETTLSSSTRSIQLHHDCKTPLRNLNSVFILKGNSRFSNSLGPWLPYADNRVDSDVLGDGLDNWRINPKNILNDETDIATLRFKGSTKGIQSKLFDTNETGDDPSQDGDGDDREEDDEVIESVVPIDEFVHNLDSGIQIKFIGTDVFEGLLELSHRNLLDAKTCPDWLTGEELAL